MDYMKFIPGESREFLFESDNKGEITAVVTACKVANVKYSLFKNKKNGNWRVFYTVKDVIQEKFEEIIKTYRDVEAIIS